MSDLPGMMGNPAMPGNSAMPLSQYGGAKPSKSLTMSGYDNYLGSPLMPLSQETSTTYGGAKPGKAPTLKQPAAPDPFKLIQEQAKANRPNEKTPMGTKTFSYDPATGTYNAETTFAPEMQNLYNQRMQMVGEDVPVANLPRPGDFASMGEQAQNAVYGRSMGMLEPTLQNQQNDLNSRLANQGIAQGTEAYTRAQGDLSRNQANAREMAAQDAITQGNQLENQMFGQAMQSGQTGFNENLSRRQQLYNELASLMGTQQIGAIQPLDVTGPYNQQYLGQLNSTNATNQYNQAQNANKQQAGVAGLGLLASLLL